MTIKLKRIIRFFLPKFIVEILKSLIYTVKCKRSIKDQCIVNNGSERFFILGTPSHANLGDHAITISEIIFLKELFGDRFVYDFSSLEVEYAMNLIKTIININDILILQGGGNMGTLWYFEEERRYHIIEVFPKNKIVVFPQSVFYENTENAIKKLRLSKKYYNNHSNLYMIARDRYSYSLMKDYYSSCKVFLTPDIVLFLDRSVPFFYRDGVLLCLREDKEGIIDSLDKKLILKIAKTFTDNINYTDTVLDIDTHINRANRVNYFEAKLVEFKKSKLVITDRLHGMVFAAITATPCIVISNSYHKVKGLYEWIDYLDYVSFVEKAAQINEDLFKSLWYQDHIGFNNTNLIKEFEPLRKILKGEV